MRASRLPFFLTTLGTLTLLCPPARSADVEIQLPAGGGFVVKDNTGAIGRMRVDESTGNISRNGALFVHTTGTNNTFVGRNAGNQVTSGYGRNVAFGEGALSSNTVGYRNSAFGFEALRGTTGSNNSAFGFEALRNTTGSNNSAFGIDALRYNTTGSRNSAFGVIALEKNTTGGYNSAFGQAALRYNTTGSENSAFGFGALLFNTTSSGNSAFGRGALYANTADNNAAFGFRALGSNITGNGNVAVGSGSLASNRTHSRNTAVGSGALANSDGDNNSAFGYNALSTQTLGSAFDNSAFGDRALANNTASRNSAFGQSALYLNDTGANNAAFGDDALANNTIGSRNIAVGRMAGSSQTTGSDNIYLANVGVAGESSQIKIGTAGTHTDAFIAGVNGNVVAGSAVFVTSSGELGVAASSFRFKREVRDMGAASDRLMRLRPVTFEYREAVDGGVDGRHYGLIAEEVAEVAPELVVYDDDGEPFSIRYHVLAPMLLNEVQKQQRTIHKQAEELAALRQWVCGNDSAAGPCL